MAICRKTGAPAKCKIRKKIRGLLLLNLVVASKHHVDGFPHASVLAIESHRLATVAQAALMSKDISEMQKQTPGGRKRNHPKMRGRAWQTGESSDTASDDSSVHSKASSVHSKALAAQIFHGSEVTVGCFFKIIIYH